MNIQFSLSILIRHCKPNALILVGAWDQRIGIQKSERLPKFALGVTFKLLSTDGEWFE